MDRIKRFITCHVPVSACNFKCSYCYIGQLQYNTNRIIDFCMSPKDIAERLSPDALGGKCYFNLCGNGETMLHPQLIELVSELTKKGHYVDIITNGTITQKINKLINELSAEQQSHLFIKFSFHWVELNKKQGLLDTFVNNVHAISNTQISYSVEITPHDELIPLIDEIKAFSMEQFGAYPHITVARNESTEDIELLTDLTREEYQKTWSTFDSKLFDFKFRIFNQKRDEFCYAGDRSLEIDLESGTYKQCYRGAVLGNLKDNKPINFLACGNCPMPHCFNGHAFLAFGDIPQLSTPSYNEERDRITVDGKHWVKDKCREFFSTKVFESNEEYSDEMKSKAIKQTESLLLKQRIKAPFDKVMRKIKTRKK